MDIKKFKKGDLILQEGSLENEMYFISYGKVNVFKVINEEKIDLAILGPDAFFGEMSMFLREHRTASIEAMEDTEIKGYSKETFINLIRDDPDVALEVITTMAQRIKDAHGIISKMMGEKKGLEIIYGKI